MICPFHGNQTLYDPTRVEVREPSDNELGKASLKMPGHYPTGNWTHGEVTNRSRGWWRQLGKSKDDVKRCSRLKRLGKMITKWSGTIFNILCVEYWRSVFSRKGMEPGKVDSSRRQDTFNHLPSITYGANDQRIRISVPKDRTIKL